MKDKGSRQPSESTMKGLKIVKKWRALSPYPGQYQPFLQSLRVLHGEETYKLANHEGHEVHEEMESSVAVSEAMSQFPSSASW